MNTDPQPWYLLLLLSRQKITIITYRVQVVGVARHNPRALGNGLLLLVEGKADATDGEEGQRQHHQHHHQRRLRARRVHLLIVNR